MAEDREQALPAALGRPNPSGWLAGVPSERPELTPLSSQAMGRAGHGEGVQTASR